MPTAQPILHNSSSSSSNNRMYSNSNSNIYGQTQFHASTRAAAGPARAASAEVTFLDQSCLNGPNGSAFLAFPLYLPFSLVYLFCSLSLPLFLWSFHQSETIKPNQSVPPVPLGQFFSALVGERRPEKWYSRTLKQGCRQGLLRFLTTKYKPRSGLWGMNQHSRSGESCPHARLEFVRRKLWTTMRRPAATLQTAGNVQPLSRTSTP